MVCVDLKYLLESEDIDTERSLVFVPKLVVVANSDGGNNHFAGTTSSRTTPGSATQKIANGKGSALSWTEVYIRLPLPNNGRQRSDTERWRGPAMILPADGSSRS